jgi:hypothetical protein
MTLPFNNDHTHLSQGRYANRFREQTMYVVRDFCWRYAISDGMLFRRLIKNELVRAYCS